jgi:uncharacterized protein HemY
LVVATRRHSLSTCLYVQKYKTKVLARSNLTVFLFFVVVAVVVVVVVVDFVFLSLKACACVGAFRQQRNKQNTMHFVRR